MFVYTAHIYIYALNGNSICIPSDLYKPGDGIPNGENFTCFRIPAIVEASNVLIAFAEGRRYVGDNCYPRNPIPGSAPSKANGTSAIVLRRSMDGGQTWGEIKLVVQFGDDFQAVADTTAEKVLLHVQYSPKAILNEKSNQTTKLHQITSHDLGLTWEEPIPINKDNKPLLGIWDGLMVGPGAALQLRSSNPYYPGRILWCGHRKDAVYHRVSPIWSSDDHGAHHTLQAVLPMDAAPPTVEYGPDECVFVELKNGTIRYDARNISPRHSGHSARMYSLSNDGGDTWGPLLYDDKLAANPNCQAAMTTANKGSIILATAPSRTQRMNMTLHRSTDGGLSWPHRHQLYDGQSGYSSVVALNDIQNNAAVLFERNDSALCTTGSSCKITLALVKDEEV